MSKLRPLVLLIAAAVTVLAFNIDRARAASAVASGCGLHVLKRIDGVIAVDYIEVPQGQTVRLSAGDILTFVLPLGPGQSGDLLQQGKPKGDVVVTCKDGTLRVVVRFADGRERQLPPVNIADLTSYDVRVNIVGGDGTKQALMIRRYTDVGPASGPVIDMFSGMIPLNPGDYSITTQVTEHEPPVHVEGSVALRLDEELIIIRGALPDGTTGDFIVDFGASGTVIARRFLPPGTDVHKVKAIQYTDEGAKELDAVMGGAGGSVSGFLGNAVLSRLRFGDVSFDDVTVNVIDPMPAFDGLEVAGIVGLDLLRRANVVTLEFSGERASRLTFSPAAPPGRPAPDIDAPLEVGAKHVFVGGTIHDTAVDFLVDTGARSSILSAGLAEHAGLQLSDDGGRDFRGLDGKPLPAKSATVDQWALGGGTVSSWRFYVTELPVFDTMGLHESGALLGVDFFLRYAVVELDFLHERIRFRN